MKKLLELFLTFFKIGLFTFGGGYAMISIIENDCVNNKKWINKEDMNQIVILSESTPGPIAINASTFVGYKVSKTLGSIVASIAMVLPSLIIITLISIFLSQFKENIFIQFVFEALRASVIILMIQALLNLSKNTKKNLIFYSLLLASFILNFFFKVKAIYIIIFALLYTFIYILVSKKEETNNA